MNDPITLKLDTPENVQATAHELGAALCRCLNQNNTPPAWTYAPPPLNFCWLTLYLNGPDGIRLHVTKQNGVNRLSIAAAEPENFPRDARAPSIPRPRITVDAGRKPSAIANAIAARMFPETIKWTIAAHENAKAANDYDAQTRATLETLKRYRVTAYRDGHDATGTIGNAYTRAQVHGDRLRLTIDTDAGQLPHILNAMQNNPRKD